MTVREARNKSCSLLLFLFFYRFFTTKLVGDHQRTVVTMRPNTLSAILARDIPTSKSERIKNGFCFLLLSLTEWLIALYAFLFSFFIFTNSLARRILKDDRSKIFLRSVANRKPYGRSVRCRSIIDRTTRPRPRSVDACNVGTIETHRFSDPSPLSQGVLCAIVRSHTVKLSGWFCRRKTCSWSQRSNETRCIVKCKKKKN